MSPQMAREIVYRASGNADTPAADYSDWARLHSETAALFALIESGNWQPCVVYEQAEQALSPAHEAEQTPLPAPEEAQDGGERAIAFASYPLRHLEGGPRRLLALDSISAAVEAYFSNVEQTAAHEQLKEQLRGRVAQRRTRVAAKLHSLREQLARAAEVETLRYKGEMIFAYQYAIAPSASSLSVPAPAGEGEISIALDPQLTMAENAQRYFRDYHKAQAAGAELPERVAATEQELAYLDEMSEMINQAQGYEDINLTARELADLDKPPAPPKPTRQKQKAKLALPPGLGKLLRLTSPDGMEVYVGKSMRQNEYLSFKVAAPDDIWLHARGVPGAHVIIKMQGIPQPPPRTLLFAAGLAAGRSQARHDTAAEVMYTRARHLRKPPGAPPGTLLYSHEQSIRVAPLPSGEEKL
jgi:predicted ribosome quality control (RQC) complex YloA/Tae2 family protein